MKSPTPANPRHTSPHLALWWIMSFLLLSLHRQHKVIGQTLRSPNAKTSSITWQITSHRCRIRGRICYLSPHWISNGKEEAVVGEGLSSGRKQGPFMGCPMWKPTEQKDRCLGCLLNGFQLWEIIQTSVTNLELITLWVRGKGNVVLKCNYYE
jgi:hypothetical protein